MTDGQILKQILGQILGQILRQILAGTNSRTDSRTRFWDWDKDSKTDSGWLRMLADGQAF